MGLYKKIKKALKRTIKGIAKNPFKAALIAGAAALTGGAASFLGASSLMAGAATATVAAAGAKSMEQGQAMAEKEAKAQKEYNNAINAENERAYAAQRASLLSMRRNYTQETGVGALKRKKATTSYNEDLLG